MSFSIKEICQIAKQCSNLGVKELKAGDFSISFYPDSVEHTGQSSYAVKLPKNIKVSRQASRAADEIERKSIEEQEQLEQEEKQSESLILDPEDYEESVIKGFADGREEE